MSSAAERRQVISADSATVHVHELAAGIDALVQHTNSPQAFRSCLSNPGQLNALVNGIGVFIAVDACFQGGAQKLGQILENIMEQEDEEQHQFLTALCAVHDLAPLQDEDGKVRTDRTGYVHALFGAYPELGRRSGHDTLAGKRLTYYLAQARKHSDSREDIEDKSLRMSTAPPGTPDGSAFRQMWSVLNDEERAFFAEIARKAKLPINRWRREWEVIEEQKRRRREGQPSFSAAALKAAIFPQSSHIRPAERTKMMHQLPATVWFTGYSGSGKSTLAYALESRLAGQGHVCTVLDGDAVRHVLNPDLGFSVADRAENIRRTASVARLMNDCGLIVIASLISPCSADRDMARGIIGDARFLEVHLSADVATCEQRDPKGLYARARSGKLREFTGVSAPYEAPENPALVLDTAKLSIKECMQELMNLLAPRLQTTGQEEQGAPQ